jgi:hypothetical protein
MFDGKPGDFSYKGRNGSGKQIGISITKGTKVVWVEPINSKGIVANCYMTVPLDKVDDLIKALKEESKS